MKKLLKVLSVIFIITLSTGCFKKIEKISYTDFNEYFTNKTEYTLLDNTSKYGINIRRYVEAGEGNFQIFYIEFDNEKNADKYINNIYVSNKNNKVKRYKNYTYIKSNKNTYLRLYKTKNVIVLGQTKNKKYKSKMKKVLKDLGY